MNETITNIVNNAIEQWEAAGDEYNLPCLKNAESLFLLAIQKSPEPYSRLYALLSMVYYDMGLSYINNNGRNAEKFMKKSYNSATLYANKALDLNKFEFRAQLIKTYISADNLKYLNGGLSNLVPQSGGGILDSFFEFTGRAVGTGIAATQVSLSKANFKNELNNLLTLFNSKKAEYYIEFSEYYFMAERFFIIADFCHENNLFGKNEIFKALSEVKEQDIDFEDISDDSKEEALSELNRITLLSQARCC